MARQLSSRPHRILSSASTSLLSGRDKDPARSEPAPVPLRPLREQVGDLYAGHVGAVLNILRLRGVPASEREDLAHDVFVRVQEAWARCRSQGAPRPWIAEIARNVARNHRQAQQTPALLANDEGLT